MKLIPITLKLSTTSKKPLQALTLSGSQLMKTAKAKQSLGILWKFSNSPKTPTVSLFMKSPNLLSKTLFNTPEKSIWIWCTHSKPAKL
jgi:hypothetical protein